jgi:hypothetical protein
VYPNLVEDLLRAGPEHNPQIAHVCAVLSGWAYSQPNTVAMMMVRMGLEQNRCRYIGLFNDTMFVCSTAFLIQSRCGRVAFLAYRGTEPVNFINWLTDIDIKTETIRVPSTRGFDARAAVPEVHGGFYRNQRATWFDVAGGLALALEGKSILAGSDPAPSAEAHASDREIQPLQALYITGHSLGAAMGAMAAFRLARDEAYAQIRSKVRGIYTFGQPMIGNSAFAAECEQYPLLSERMFRHVYQDDVVPVLPPKDSGDFKHFGRQLESHKVETKGATKSFEWKPSAGSVSQLSSLTGIAVAASDFVIEQFPKLRKLTAMARHAPIVKHSGLGYSLYDHSTSNYIQCSQPEGVLTEFGDF